jgi:hypothetical protein
MLTCDDAREQIALEPNNSDPAIVTHLGRCATCRNYRRRHTALDAALRPELRWEPSAALTAQLLALAALPASALAVARPVALRPRPKEWYVRLVYLLTLAVIGVSVAVAWQFTAMLSAEMGLSGALAELAAGPGRVLADLARQMPEGQSVLALLGRVRDLSMWLLMVAILWRLGEQYSPRRGTSQSLQS